MGLEQIQSQHAGGMLLPPVQKLVATLIKSSPVVSSPPKWVVFFFAKSLSFLDDFVETCCLL
jgi:hypothetical protein